MTDGPERARLRTYLTGAKDEASDLAGDNWRFCGDILKDTASALRRGAKQIRDGEGDGAEGGLSGMMADALLSAFEASSASMEDKGTRLVAGGDALRDTAQVMRQAKAAEASMADLNQPPAYKAPTPSPGAPPTPEEIHAEAGKRQAANQEMAAYNTARAEQEAAAAQWTQKLDAVFLGSIPPMKAIHGQPDPTEPPPTVPSSPTGPSVPTTPGTPPGTPGAPDPTDSTDPKDPEKPDRPDRPEKPEPERPEKPEPERPERPEKPEPINPEKPEPIDPQRPITTPTHPTHPTDVQGPTSTVSGSSQSGVTYNPTAGQAPAAVTGGSTGGVSAAAMGAAGAAGGASGMAGGIRAGSAPAPAGSSPARPIGATGRSASAGALSRPAGSAGSAAARGASAGSPASARGAGSAASARGAGAAGARGAGSAGARGAGSAGGRGAGSAGGRGAGQGSGRGSSGARGAGAGGASGRGGRKGDRDQVTDRDSLVYEQDWLGDDDVAPGVLD